MPQVTETGLDWARRLRFNTVATSQNAPLIDCIADHLRTLGVPLLTRSEGGSGPVRDAGRRQARRVILSATPTPCPGTGQA